MSLWHNLTKCHERQAFSFGLLIQATPHPSFTQEHGNFGCFVGRSSLRCRNVVHYLPVEDACISGGVSLIVHILGTKTWGLEWFFRFEALNITEMHPVCAFSCLRLIAVAHNFVWWFFGSLPPRPPAQTFDICQPPPPLLVTNNRPIGGSVQVRTLLHGRAIWAVWPILSLHDVLKIYKWI